jgi:zinc/manganese transport system permease protein
MPTTSLELGIVLPAFLAGLLVIATHVPLGLQVLARGIVFIDLAIAQVAGLGVIVADGFGWEPQGWRVQVAACLAALLGALLLTWTDKRWPEVQEALIGVLFVVAASAALLMLANNPHGGEHLKDLLVGQILWVSPASLVPVAVIYAAILALWFTLRARLGHIGFYLLFAVAVTASVQLVGVYLVFASLIVPALAARGRSPRRQLPVAYAVGIAGYAAGILASALLDLPTGPVIVVALTLIFIAVARRSPRSTEKG